MRGCNINDDKTESDSVTAVELQKKRRLLYFSDGFMEEISDSDGEDIELGVDNDMNTNINVADLTLTSQLIYQVYQIGNHILSGIDYLGESLASILGITDPKYYTASDIENVKNDVDQSELNTYGHFSDWHSNNNCTDVITSTTFLQNPANRIP